MAPGLAPLPPRRAPTASAALLLILAALLALSSGAGFADAFLAPSRRQRGGGGASASASASAASSRLLALSAGSTTVDAPTRERTDRDTSRRTRRSSDRDRDRSGGLSLDDDDGTDHPDLEYLVDPRESREADDPFHLLLLGSTFDKPRVTLPYVAGSLEYVLGMPGGEAAELAGFAREEGVSCLGTWARSECLGLGKQLQRRDLVCRVVPYCEGGQRGWQARDASSHSEAASSSSSSSGF
jgi:hypothetical protein